MLSLQDHMPFEKGYYYMTTTTVVTKPGTFRGTDYSIITRSRDFIWWQLLLSNKI